MFYLTTVKQINCGRNFAPIYIKECGSVHIITFAVWQVNTGFVFKGIVRVTGEAMESYA